MAATTSSATPQSQPMSGDGSVKLSRYRTVRKAQLKQLQADSTPDAMPTPPPPDPETAQVPQTIQRSMSRYHRRGAPSRPQNAKVDPVPPIPVAAPVKQSPPRESGRPRTDSHRIAGQRAPPPHPHPETPAESAHARRPRGPSIARHEEAALQGTLLDQQARRKAQVPVNSEGEQVLANERARYEKIKAQQRAERAERDKVLQAERLKREQEEEEIQRIEREKAAEEERIQQAKDEEREREAREKAEAKQRVREEKAARKRRPTDATVPSRDIHSSSHSSAKGSSNSPESSRKIGAIFRRKKEDETPRTSMATEERRPKTSHVSPPKTSHGSPPKWELPTIKPGGGGIVPLSDAPVSGVVGAERRVRVRFGKSEITLPAEPTTTALQLIRSASTVMSEQFNPREAVIYEYYKPQGVRRPLRMYEHVRTVMNSWEDDVQNYLIIESANTENHQELYDRHAPQEEQLKQFERSLMYQYKPGKWDDRWITLRVDGQITAAKNQAGKDMVTVCHLSDFDIYKPLPETKKRRKPSKKVLLSIKSQQKSAMFLDKTNYIHHFCTEDNSLADQFFRAIQSWRSYYLVSRMGQGPAGKTAQLAPESANGHKRSKSAESHYLLGSFNDLGLDFSSYAKPPEPQETPKRNDSFDENRPLGAFGMVMPSAQEHSRTLHQRQLSQRRERSRLPPTAMRHGIPNKLSARDDALQALTGNARQSWDSNGTGDGAFNPQGLLGSRYEQRRHLAKPSQDFSSSGSGLQRNTSVRSTRSQRRNSVDSATLGRSNSTRRPDFGKPLLDFTPQYKEPPQFTKRGKGYKPDGASAGGLIDSATSPDNPIQLPNSNDWRARPKTSGGPLDRSKSINRSKSTRVQPNGLPPDSSDEAFTGGLLAQTTRLGKSGAGANPGHGVMSGNHANGPMLDLNEASLFADGTLLRKMEAQNLGNPIAKEPWRVD